MEYNNSRKRLGAGVKFKKLQVAIPVLSCNGYCNGRGNGEMEMPVKLYDKPQLKRPYLVVGWPDAGQVGTMAVDYLKRKLNAQPLAEIDAHDFCFQPKSVVRMGIMEDMEFTKNEFSYWKNESGENDLIIFSSEPPDCRHYQFVNIVLDVAQQYGLERVCGVGGLWAGILHTVEPRVFAVVNKLYLREDMKGYDGVDVRMNYHGPTSMNGVLFMAAQRRGVEGNGLWGGGPNYIAQMPSPRVCCAVLDVLTQMLRLKLDLGEIESQAEYAEQQIDKLVSYVREQRPDFDEYLEKLGKGMRPEPTMENKQGFFKEIEDFLRSQKGE